MSQPRMISVTIEEHEWRPADENDPSRPHLTGPSLLINGLPMHLEAWRVATDISGVQDAVDAEMERDFTDLHNAVHADGPFHSITIGEFAYIIVASPYCV